MIVMTDEERGAFLRNFAKNAIDAGLEKDFPQLFRGFRSVVDEGREMTYSIGQNGSPVKLDILIEQYTDDIIHMRFDYSDKHGDPLGAEYDEFFPYGVVEDGSLFGDYVKRYVKAYVGMINSGADRDILQFHMELEDNDSHFGDYNRNRENAEALVFIHTILKVAKRFDMGFDVLKFSYTKENMGFHDDRLRKFPFGAFRPDFPEYMTLRSYNEDIDIDFVTIYQAIQLRAHYTVYDDETGNGVAFNERKGFDSRGWDGKPFVTMVSEWFEKFMNGYLEKKKAFPSHEKEGVCGVLEEDIVDCLWSMKKEDEDVLVQKKA